MISVEIRNAEQVVEKLDTMSDRPKRKTLHLKFYSQPSFVVKERPGEFECNDEREKDGHLAKKPEDSRSQLRG